MHEAIHRFSESAYIIILVEKGFIILAIPKKNWQN